MKQMNKLTMELVTLVLANRADEAIAILEKGDFDDDVLTDLFMFREFGDEDYPANPLPLYVLTQANGIYFRSDDFIEKSMPDVMRNREGIKKLLDYWRSKGFPVDEAPDFTKWRGVCAHFYDGFKDVADEILGGSVSQLIEMGYDENEVRMCLALLTYDKPEIDRQIELGTNPDVWISEDAAPEYCDRSTGWSGLETAYDSVSDAQICFDNWYYWRSKPGDRLEPAEYDQIRGLLGAAAYEELLPALDRLAGKAKTDNN